MQTHIEGFSSSALTALIKRTKKNEEEVGYFAASNIFIYKVFKSQLKPFCINLNLFVKYHRVGGKRRSVD